MKSKEYYLKLSEQIYNDLSNDEKMYLNHIGLQVRQLPDNEEDEIVKHCKKEIAKNYQKINDHLFDLRNK